MGQSQGKKLREAIKNNHPLKIVGTINAYSALLAEKEGHHAIYLSGGGVAASSLGVPDLGISSLQDVLIDVERITNATSVPLLVDADTGWGGAFNIARSIKSLRLAAPGGQILHFLHFYSFINSRSYKIDSYFAILTTVCEGKIQN